MAGRDILADDFQTAAPAAAPTGGRDILADTPEEERSNRLRKIARGAMSQDPGASDLYSDSFTLGLMKPVSGVATGLGNLVTGQSGFGEGYTAGTGAYQDMLDEASKNAGWGGTAANIAGSLTAGGPARGAVAEGVWPVVKNAMGLGAVEGAARNSEDVGSAVGGAAGGAATAGLTSAAIGAATRAPGFRQRRAAAREAARGTPPDVIKDQARTLYKQLDDANVAYSDVQSVDLVDETISDLRQNSWSPKGIHSPLNGIIDQLSELRGQPLSLGRLQQLRSEATAEAASTEPEVRRMAGRILQSIDGFVGHVDPELSSIPREQIGPMWKEARRLWKTATVAEDIGWRMGKAENRAATSNSGGNVENAIRQNIRQVVDKAEQPRRYNPYTEAELAQMQRVVEGTPTQNLLRRTGNTFGGSGPLAGVQGTTMGGTSALLSSALGGAEPTTAALLGVGTAAGLYGAGRAARAGSTAIAQNEADALMRLVTTGSLRPYASVPAGPPTRQALARLMIQQQAARGVGVGAAGLATGQ